jgi:alkylation response protein AidB-like acyl-CoA dehydrogenase
MSRNLDELFMYPKEWMDEECAGVVRLVRQWADREIVTKRMEYRENYQKLFVDKFRKLGLDIGLQKLAVPSELGGFGWNSQGHAYGMLTLACEIGRADASAGVLFASTCTAFSLFAMKHNLNEMLCSSISPIFSGDKLRVVSFILPGAGYTGSDTPLFLGRSIIAEAGAGKGPCTITGKDLHPLFAGGTADLYCVVCAGNKGKPCIALVPGEAKGISRGPDLLTTGLNACGNAEVSFDGVDLPKENLIDRDGAVEMLYTWLNLLLGGVSIGAATNFFELLADWSDNRVIKGGTTLKENPLCASVLADVAEEIALAKLLLYDLAAIIAKPSSLDASSLVRTFTFAQMIGSRVQQGAMRAMNRGLELMGSAGYAKEWHVEKDWRDVKTIQSVLCGAGAEAPVKMDTARFFYSCTEI